MKKILFAFAIVPASVALTQPLFAFTLAELQGDWQEFDTLENGQYAKACSSEFDEDLKANFSWETKAKFAITDGKVSYEYSQNFYSDETCTSLMAVSRTYYTEPMAIRDVKMNGDQLQSFVLPVDYTKGREVYLAKTQDGVAYYAGIVEEAGVEVEYEASPWEHTENTLSLSEVTVVDDNTLLLKSGDEEIKLVRIP